MIIGFAVAKLKIVQSKDSVVLSKISLYLLMPSAIINAFDFERSGDLMNGLLFAFLAAIVVHVILYLLDILYGKCINKSPVERASVMYSNAGNLIIPIVSFVLGDEWVIFSTAFLTVHSMLHLLGYDHVNSDEEDADMRRRQREILEGMGLNVK